MSAPRKLSGKLREAVLDMFVDQRASFVRAVTGRSMLPTIGEGDLVAIVPLDGEPQRGDILYYRHSDVDEAVHRFLGPATHDDGVPLLRTRGDGVSRLDAALERGRVLGRVVAVRSGGVWWDLTQGGGRAWALALALHDLAWARAAVLATLLERLLRRAGIGAQLSPAVAAVDRGLLRWAHRWLFRRLHVALPAVDGVPAGFGGAPHAPGTR